MKIFCTILPVFWHDHFKYIICNLAVNFAGFRKCLAEHTAYYLVTLLGITYRTGFIEQCCQMV